MLPFGLTRRAPAFPIGVDVGFDALRMVQLAPAAGGGGGGGGLRVVAAVERPLPAAAAQGAVEARVAAAVAALKQALRERHFHGRRVVAALPRELVHVRPMRLPPMPDADLAWAVSTDARDLFPFDTAKARLQYLDAGEVRQGAAAAEIRRELLVVAAGEALVDAYVEQLHAAGAVVDSLDIEPCAAYRAASRARPPGCDDGEPDPAAATAPCALIDVGAGRSQVVIGRGPQVRVVRLAEIGGRHFRRAVAQKLGIAEDEADRLRRRLAEVPAGALPTIAAAAGHAGRVPLGTSVGRAVSDAMRALVESLAREAALALRYHAVAFRGPGPTRVWLAGAEAGDPLVRSALAAALPCPVEPIGSFPDLGLPPPTCEAMPGGPAPWAVALGLALRRVGEPAGGAATPDGRREPESSRQSRDAAAPVFRTNTIPAEASHV